MPMPDAVLSAEVLAKLRARIDFEKSMLELKLPTRSNLDANIRARKRV
jgi:hypothetical protein